MVLREELESEKTSFCDGKIIDSNVDLETSEEQRQRLRSLYAIYFTMFLMSLGFSLTLTGVWPYLVKLDESAQKQFMGYVVAANPLGQMIVSPLMGWWANRLGTVRLPLLVSLSLFTFSSSLYSCLEIMPGDRKMNMLVARFLVGVSSANIAVARSYLSAATKVSERTRAISMVSLAQVIGFIVGPGLQALVTPLGHNGFIFLGFPINMYTAAGWMNVFMGVINILLFLPWCFKEHRIAAREAMLLQGCSSEKETWKLLKPDLLASWTLIVAFFVLVFNFVLLETLGTSLTMDQFAWTKSEALYYMGIIMSAGAVIACVMFLVIEPLCRRFDERKVMIWGGFFLMMLGRFMYIPVGTDPPIIAESEFDNLNSTAPLNSTNYAEVVGCPAYVQDWCRYTPRLTLEQFLIGYIFTAMGFPIGVTLIQTIFSKILGPRPQGVWMGIMTGSGCASRVFGPVFVAQIYTNFGTYYTFGLTGTMMFVAMIWLLTVSNRLIPPTEISDDKQQGSKRNRIN